MRAKGTKRLIAVTGFGAGDSRGHGGILYDAVLFPLVLKRVYDDKDIAEQIIKASGLDWTIVRPGALTNAEAARPLPRADRSRRLGRRLHRARRRRRFPGAAGRRTRRTCGKTPVLIG